MSGIRTRRPSVALVVAVLALIVALGGTAFAGPVAQLARLVSGDKLIKKHSLSGNRLRNHTLTGKQINLSKLGTVPSAGFAGSAGSAPPSGGAGGGLAGSYPNPSIASGAVTPSKFGTIPAVRTANSADESISDNTPTAVTFDTNVYDNSSMHSTTTDTSRLTAPVTGIYDIWGNIEWQVVSAGQRSVGVVVDGGAGGTVAQVREQAPSGIAPDQVVSTQVKLNAGDYVELVVFQNSGVPLSVRFTTYSPAFAMHWVGPA